MQRQCGPLPGWTRRPNARGRRHGSGANFSPGVLYDVTGYVGHGPDALLPAVCGYTSLYGATRHYFAWYLLNVAELPDHVVAAQLRHTDGGTLVREWYGHPDAAMARERIRAAFRTVAPVVALPVSHETSHDVAQTAS